ncbi:MAG: DUF4347 domain-containing protein [Pseudomonadota bacterium]
MLFSRLRQFVAQNKTTATSSAEPALVSSRLMLALEPRFLYDGALVSTGLEGLTDSTPPAAESMPLDVTPVITEPSPSNESPACDTPDTDGSLPPGQTEGPDVATVAPENSTDEIAGIAPAANAPPSSEEASADSDTDASHVDALNDANAIPSTSPSPEGTTEIVIIDSGVDNPLELTQNLSPATEVYVLDANQDGIVQINDILNAHDSVDALHIFSHGSSGNVTLGNTQLNSDTINDYKATLADWGDSFAGDGDILIYGCNVGSGEKGTEFIKSLAELTGTDVAASSDATGSGQGENWKLEVQSGDVTSEDLVSNELMAGSSISLTTAETSIEVDGSGNLIVTDINHETADTLTLRTDGNTIFITDVNNILTSSISGATGAGTNQITVSLTDFTGGIIVNTMGGDDLLTVDYTSGDFSRQITYNGGDNVTATGDALSLLGGTSAVFSFANASDGTVDISGNATLSYTGLEPIALSGLLVDVTLDFSNVTETITITDLGGGQTHVTSTASESFTLFSLPTNSLTINAGDGDDIINLVSLDRNFAASLTINGEAGNDVITIGSGVNVSNATINGNDGNDTIINNGGVNEIAGGDGNDSITNSAGGSVLEIYGSQGDDEITNNGWVGSAINGGAGNDSITISSSGEAYQIIGGDGNDSINNNHSVWVSIDGGDGTDIITNNGSIGTFIDGGDGADIIINEATGSVLEIHGNQGNDEITNRGSVGLSIDGGDGADIITNEATGRILELYGSQGDDEITNHGDVYEIVGGGGNDTITNSTTGYVVAIYGGAGGDIIYNQGSIYSGIAGEAGDDTITNDGTLGAPGRDGEIFGDGGNDTITNSATGNIGAIYGGGGDDDILNQGSIYYGIAGNAGDDTITNEGTLGAPGRDGEIFGDRGNDTITNSTGGSVNHIIGGGGDDLVINQGNVAGDIKGNGGNDLLANIGSVGGTITGGSGDDMIGNMGTIVSDILGKSGNDLLANIGSVGRTINGGAGDDLIVNLDVAFVLGPVFGPIVSPFLSSLGIGNATAGSLRGSNGDDIIVYSQGSVNSSNTVDVDGGNGADILAALYNSGTFSGDGSGTVTTGTVIHPGGTDVWDNFEGVYILGTLGPDVLNFGPMATVNAVLTGPGDDQVTYYQGTVLDFMDGGAGWDTLTGRYATDAIILGDATNGSATYAGPTSPDNWSNFEDFTRLPFVDPPAGNGENQAAALSINTEPASNAGNGPQNQFAPLSPSGALYLPEGPASFDLNGYPGSPYTPGPGSLVAAALNSITGSISANLGSGGTMPGSSGSTADTQPYTAEEPAQEKSDPDDPQPDKKTLDPNSGENQESSSQEGPTDNNQEQNGDNESKPKKLLNEEGETETEGAADTASSNMQYTQRPLSDPLIFPDGFLAEVEDIAGQFETERLALLAAIQGMSEADSTDSVVCL